MDSDMLVIVLSLVMFAGSFSVGLLPATIKASNRVMNLISILGAGLLVGVALIVIIPEGMVTLNEALESQRKTKPIDPTVATALISSWDLQQSIRPIKILQTSVCMSARSVYPHLLVLADFHMEVFVREIAGFTKEQITKLHMPSEGEDTSITWYLGGSLIFGFIIMLLLDQGFHIIQERCGKKHDHEDEDVSDENITLREKLINRQECKFLQNSVHSSKGGCMRVVRCSSLQQDVPRMLSDDFTDQKLVDAMGNVYIRHGAPVVLEQDEHRESESHDHDHDHVHEHFHGDSSNLIISTIGLVVHSIADGVALGSTCYVSQGKETSLPFVIFMALLLHKCPAAIGLSTFLLHENLRIGKIIPHLLAFTSTSPISAVVSYYLFKIFQPRNTDPLVVHDDSEAFKVVGILLLISAGTFMYVAMIHILPEVYCNTETHRPHTHKHTPEDHVHDENHFSKEVELIAMITGLLLPLMLNCV